MTKTWGEWLWIVAYVFGQVMSIIHCFFILMLFGGSLMMGTQRGFDPTITTMAL